MKENKKSISLLLWLVAPFLFVWISFQYLVGNISPVSAKKSRNIPFQKYLVEAPSFPKIESYKGGLLTIWFDDAWSSQYSVAKPILDNAGVKAAIAVPTAYPKYDAYISWEKLRELQADGWEITSHSVNHECNSDEDVAAAEYEFSHAKETLIAEGLRHDIYVAPCGITSQTIINLSKKYYRALRNTQNGPNSIPVDTPYDITVMEINVDTRTTDIQRWINEAHTTNAWVILMFHQIDHNSERYSTTPELFQKMIDTVKASKIQVVLPTQVLDIKDE